MLLQKMKGEKINFTQEFSQKGKKIHAKTNKIQTCLNWKNVQYIDWANV